MQTLLPMLMPVFAGIGLFAFVVFAFRRGFSAKPRKGGSSASDAFSPGGDRDSPRP